MNNLNINPQFIGSQQTHHTKELHRIDQSKDETIIVFKIKREREILTTGLRVCGEILTHHHEGTKLMKGPSMIDPPLAECWNTALDGLSSEQSLVVAEKLFWDLLCSFLG